MEILFLVIIFALGLCFGSFVNMLMYRTADRYGLRKSSRAESRDLIKRKTKDFFTSVEMTNKRFLHFGRNDKCNTQNKNRSFCDFCGRQLKWYENIPVVSWLIQKGKTRCCHKKLPVLYPITEIVTGILFLLVWNLSKKDFSTSLEMTDVIILVVQLLVVVFLVFSAVFDLKYMILPDFSTAVLVFSAVIGILGRPQESPVQFLLSAVISFGFLYFLYLITKKKGMGFGDVKLAFFMGLFLGYPKIIVAMYIAFIFGALFGLGLMVFKKAAKKTKISFGPFLILGTLIAWFWGEQILSLSVFQFIR